MEEFFCKTKILAGAGAVSALSSLGKKRLFLVADPFFVKNGTAKRIVELSRCECSEIFDKIQPDPTVELAAEGTARLRAFAPDLLVALGGGSALDCAKAMAYFAKGDCLLAAIPTTSGSGSEVTDFAILTHDRVKHPLVDSRMRPDIAILDSDLLTALPPGLVAETGFDVLTHAVEGFTAAKAGAFTDLFAQEAFRIAYGSLPASFAGRQEVRLKLHMASCMAGVAFSQAGLGLCHAMAHSLGGRFHVPHGRLNAILLPAVIENNASSCGKKYAQLARAAGMGGSADTVALRNLKNGLIRLRRELGLPQTAFDILMFLGNNPAYKTAGEIVELRHIKANLVSVHVDRLVQEGYLTRHPVAGDRRKTELLCTPKAQDVIARGRQVQDAFTRRLLSGMSDAQREAFADALSQIETNLGQILEEEKQ